MTPHQQEVKVWQETCIEYIQRSDTAEKLHAVGLEIASSKVLLGATKEECDVLTPEYLKRRKELGTVK